MKAFIIFVAVLCLSCNATPRQADVTDVPCDRHKLTCVTDCVHELCSKATRQYRARCLAEIPSSCEVCCHPNK